MTDAYEDILYTVQERIARIALNRPKKLNAWTPAMEASVRRAMIAAAADDDVRVIVVSGEGRGFCAGADMGLLEGISSQAIDVQRVVERGAQRAAGPASELGPAVTAHYGGRFGYLMSVHKPIIAAINGPCAGIGLVFALFCDFRFASTEAKLTTAFAKRGLIAEHGASWILPRLIGPANALDLLLSSRLVDGAEAERLGLVNRAFAHERFMSEVIAYARQLADSVSPRSMAVIKAQVWKSLFQDLGAALEVADGEMAKSFTSEDFKEGVAHFIEKRAAQFSGR
ncbi:MAG TPA: enoyl-CoA hydratase [Polyangiales bacterium]|nr:enoyl-CoA hydratase [Polyangiales bacterium]